MALHLSAVVFRRQWKPPRLKPWEGPFADPTRRLPQAPDAAARRRAARQRWLAHQRAGNAAQHLTARTDAGTQTAIKSPSAGKNPIAQAASRKTTKLREYCWKLVATEADQ